MLKINLKLTKVTDPLIDLFVESFYLKEDKLLANILWTTWWLFAWLMAGAFVIRCLF